MHHSTLAKPAPQVQQLAPRAAGPAIALAAAAACASGALLALTFPPYDLHPLAWFALVPWLVAFPRLSPRAAFLLGALFGLVFFRIALAWSFGLYAPLAAICIIVFACLLGLAFRAAKTIQQRFGCTAMWLSIPFLFTGQEVLRSEALDRFRFGYAALGYSQAGNLWLAQIASLGGVYGLTFLIVAANTALAAAIQRRTRAAAIAPVAVAALIVALAALAQPTPELTASSIPVAAIQSEPTDDREYLDLARRAAADPSQPRIIVLPEHAIDGYADLPHPFVRKLAAIAREFGTYVCVGAHYRAAPGAACDFDNVALLIGPDGRTIGAQSKSVPVPLGADGNPVRTQQILETPIARLGLAVCFDADFTDITRRLVDQGAELLLIPVKNPQRWPEAQRIQQATMAQIRAIESRRFAVRAASSGVSAIVEPTGRIQAQRPQSAGPGILFGTVTPHTDRTPFTRAGHLFPRALGYVSLIAIIALNIACAPKSARSTAATTIA